MFEVTNRLFLKTVFVRMEGFIDVEEMRALATEIRKASEAYDGAPHMTLADMRGLKPHGEEAGAMLMDAIGYSRSIGNIYCAHVSDQTITRLQMLRLTSQINEEDDVTVDCVSVDEAKKVLAAKRLELFAEEAKARKGD